MGGRAVGRVERVVEYGASAVLGGAVANALWRGLDNAVPPLQLAVGAAVAGVIAWGVSMRVLGGLAVGEAHFALPIFDVKELEEFELDELLLTDRVNDELILTDDDRLEGTGPLVLDDILAEIGPDSRVVHLFGRKEMPTPGQLKSRIDDHLEQAAPSLAQPDASQALSDALAELRRSLR